MAVVKYDFDRRMYPPVMVTWNHSLIANVGFGEFRIAISGL